MVKMGYVYYPVSAHFLSEVGKQDVSTAGRKPLFYWDNWSWLPGGQKSSAITKSPKSLRQNLLGSISSGWAHNAMVQKGVRLYLKLVLKLGLPHGIGFKGMKGGVTESSWSLALWEAIDENAALVALETLAYWGRQYSGRPPKTMACVQLNWPVPMRQAGYAADGRAREVGCPMWSPEVWERESPDVELWAIYILGLWCDCNCVLGLFFEIRTMWFFFPGAYSYSYFEF